MRSLTSISFIYGTIWENGDSLEISESSLEAKCSNSVTRNFVSSKQSDIFGKESKNVSNVDLCKVSKSKLHLTKKQTKSDFEFQLTMKLWEHQKVNNI